jgi:hypothetical protein
MININELLDAKLLKHHEENQKKRNYLGASIIGDECLRKIQLQYSQHKANFSAQTLRTFAIGNALESLVAEWLRIAGFLLKTHNDNGAQFGFSTAGGRIAGHVDGIICDFPQELKQKESASTPSLWECKTMNNKNWKDTARRGVLASKPIYYAQIQLYMAYMKLDEKPCLFTALNKDTSELYLEFIHFDAEVAQLLSDRAVLVVQASERGETLPCISQDPSFFRCKMCPYHKICMQERGISE